MNSLIFNQITIGQKFMVSSGIIYQKISYDSAKPILSSDKTPINNGRTTTVFYNSKFKLTPYS